MRRRSGAATATASGSGSGALRRHTSFLMPERPRRRARLWRTLLALAAGVHALLATVDHAERGDGNGESVAASLGRGGLVDPARRRATRAAMAGSERKAVAAADRRRPAMAWIWLVRRGSWPGSAGGGGTGRVSLFGFLFFLPKISLHAVGSGNRMQKITFSHAVALATWENSDFHRPFLPYGLANRIGKPIWLFFVVVHLPLDLC